METKRCEICGKEFSPHQKRQRYCSHTCRQRAYDDEKRQKPYTGTGATSDAAPQQLQRGPVGKNQPILDDLPPSAKPCTRQGWPEGLLEARDNIGLPIFFDRDGARLTRVTGPGTISAFQLRNMGLEPDGITIPGGRLHRTIDA